MRVGLTVQGVARRLLPAVDLAAYRIVQEALTNLLRHAGPATAMVRLSYEEDHLAVQVDDDGHGATAGWPPVGGNGLLGMRERIAALGGPAAPADRAAARGPPGQDRAGRRGEQHTQIAVRLGVAVNTVSQWRKRFSQAGLPPRE